jgi:hypothetical protein
MRYYKGAAKASRRLKRCEASSQNRSYIDLKISYHMRKYWGREPAAGLKGAKLRKINKNNWC